MLFRSILNSQVVSTNGTVSLTATANPAVFNIAAGVAVGGTAGMQGSVAVNYIHSNVVAQIIGSEVTASEDIILRAISLKREDIPRGALQVASDRTPVSTFSGREGDAEDDELDNHEPRDLTAIQSLAGAVAGGGKAGVGLVVAVNHIENS